MKIHAIEYLPHKGKRFWFEGGWESYMDIDQYDHVKDSTFKERSDPWCEQVRLIHDWQVQNS